MKLDSAIYLDYNGTTPIDPEVAQAMFPTSPIISETHRALMRTAVRRNKRWMPRVAVLLRSSEPHLKKSSSLAAAARVTTSRFKA